MSKRAAPSCRVAFGHTLLEMLLSLVLLSIVMASVGSAVMFASQAVPDDSSPAGSLLVDSKVLNRIAEDLSSAQYIIEQTSQAVTIVVPDRSGDSIPDRIRYVWSGVQGEPLFYQFNDEAAVALIDSVQVFSLSFESTTVADTLPGALRRGDSEVLLAQETSLLANGTGLSAATAMNQPFEPTLSSGAVAYEPTRLDWYTNQRNTTDGVVPIAIQALDGFSPVGEAHATATVQEIDLPASASWHEVPFTTTSWISAEDERAIVFKSGEGVSSRAMMYYKADSTPYNVSSDSGASWGQGGSGSLLYRLYGYEISLGNETNVSQDHAKAVTVALQSVSEDRSPLQRKVLLMQAPPILNGFAQADFDADPTGMDLNADGKADWSHSASSFPSDSISAGLWTCDGLLTFNEASLATAAVIQVRARMRSNDTLGPTIYGPYTFNDADELLPLATQLRSDGSGGQELVVYNDINLESEHMVLSGLPSGLVDVELTLVPGQDVVSIKINRQTIASVALDRVADPGSIEPSVRFGSRGGVAEFGSVDVAVGGSAAEGGADDGALIEINAGGIGITLF